MTPKRIAYGPYPMDTGSFVEEYEITRRHISEEDRRKTVEYLNDVLANKPSDEPWEFTVKDITVVGQGHDEAANFCGQYS